jgi:multidrug resistance efflux pump
MVKFPLRKYINYIYSIEGMRGRWAAAGVAKSRAGAKANQQAQAAQAQQQASQQQIEAQQKQIEAMQQQKQQQPQSQSPPQQEDITQKLQKYADLHQKGILSDEEFQKLKADLLSKM